MGMPMAANKGWRGSRSGPGAAGSHAAEDREQYDSADRGHHNRGHIEALLVPKTQKARKDEATQKGADDADDEVGQETMAPPGNPLGKPARDDAHHPW